MKSHQVIEKIRELVESGRKNITIMAEDKDAHKYEVRVIAMPELSKNEINGSAAVVIDGNHYRDMTLKAVMPIFDHMITASVK